MDKAVYTLIVLVGSALMIGYAGYTEPAQQAEVLEPAANAAAYDMLAKGLSFDEPNP